MDLNTLSTELASPAPLWALLAAALLAFLAGWLPTWFRLRAQLREGESREAEIQRLEMELAERQERLHEAKTRMAVAEERAGRLPDLEDSAAEQAERIENLRSECAGLRTQLEAERSSLAEKLEVMQKAEARLADQFDSLAQRILDEKTRKFTEQNQTQLDGLLAPFRQQLVDFRSKVDEMHLHDAKDRASLKQEIEHLRLQTQRINEEAINLTQALKGDKKLQGNWGELILEKVLERSGLRKGIEYETQASLRDGGQRLFRPDVIVRLPEGRDVVIDSKVSLVAYERCCALDDGPEREAALREHIQAVRNHIRSLAEKDYAGLEGLRSLDYILLFMPIEAAFRLAFQHDERLFDDALQSHIVLVSPTTLMATLRTVENIWRFERRDENARLIAERAGAIYDKLRGFVEDLEKLGLQLGGARRAYDDAMNKLTTGRGNLIGQAERLVDLGVKVNKRLPKSVLERSELELGGGDGAVLPTPPVEDTGEGATGSA
jgi:DNA recombination protein RmuC